MATMKTRIVLKNDSLENWNAEGSIVLKQGEIGLARVNIDVADGEGGYLTKPVYLMKVGHDNKKFSELEWLAAPASDVYGWAKKSSMDYADLPETLRTEIDDLQAAIGDGGSVADAIKAAVEALDVEDTAVEKQFVTAVAETDGKISVSRRALSADDIPALEISKITNLQGALDAKVETSAFNTFKNENTQAIANAQAAAEAKAATAQAAAEAADAKAVAVDGKLDTEIARAKAAEEANAAAAKAADDKAVEAASAASTAQGTANEALAAAGVADGKAVAAQGAADALAAKVGTVPEGSTVMGIIQNIQENAYDDTEIRGLISGLDTNKADKTQVATDIGAAKTELEGKITAASNTAAANLKAHTDQYALDKAALEEADADQVERIATLEGQITGLTGAMHFKGVIEGDELPTIADDNYVAGDVVLFGKKEYVCDGTKWVELGDEGSLATQEQVNAAKEAAIAAAAADATTKANAAQAAAELTAKNYTDGEAAKLQQAITDAVAAEAAIARAAEQANAKAASDAAAAAAAAQADVDALEKVAIQEVTGANGIVVSGTGTAREVGISATEVFVFDCGTATTVE